MTSRYSGYMMSADIMWPKKKHEGIEKGQSRGRVPDSFMRLHLANKQRVRRDGSDDTTYLDF